MKTQSTFYVIYLARQELYESFLFTHTVDPALADRYNTLEQAEKQLTWYSKEKPDWVVRENVQIVKINLIQDVEIETVS